MKFCARVISSYLSALTLTRCVLDTNSTNSYGPSQKSVHRLLNLTHIGKQVELSLTRFPLSVVRFREVSPVGISLKIFILRRPFPNFEPSKQQVTLTDLRKIVKPLRTVASNRRTLRLTWLAHLFSMLRVPFQWMSRNSFLKKNSKIHVIKPFYIITLILNKEGFL